MIIKILLIAGIAGVSLVALRGSTSAMNLALRRIAALAFVAVTGMAIALPDSVTWLAERVGVAQGSNLVLYGLVLAFLFVSVGLHQRIHAVEGRLTRVTRELALLASSPSEPSGSVGLEKKQLTDARIDDTAGSTA